MKKYVYAVIMIVYIGLSIIVINYASNYMLNNNYTIIASRARDIAILTAKTFSLTEREVEELKKLDFKDLILHPANIRLEDMFNDKYGYDDIEFVYVMVKMDEVRYRVTKEYEAFFEAQSGTPLDIVYLVDVVVGKTIDETYFDDVKRYTYARESDEAAFRDKTPSYAMMDSEYGFLITGYAPVYTTEGAFVGILGVDINIKEYEESANLIRLLLLIVFLLPSGALTAVYVLLYVFNLKKVLITAQTDPLTSVKNRRFMEKYLSQAIKEHYKKQLPLSVIMIDIDYFKKYNDNYGHQQGDKVLIDVTAAITSVLRDRTDVICRYGGEEFLVILTNTKISDANGIAERIKTKVNGLAIKHDYSSVCDVVTVSQGIYSAVPLNAASDKTFIEYADKGLYEAKNTGRNKYVMVESEQNAI
jgi:diguanylate cyclase (GGDEF)-like protein